jgi:cell division protein FtsA
MSRSHIAGLDLGTTKVCVVVARSVGGAAEIIGMGQAPSAGMRKGVVVDMEAVTESITKAIRAAEESAGVDINRAYVGVSGSHLSCMKSFGTTGVRGREVSEQDVENVLNSAGTVLIPVEREVLHVMPMDYVLDGQDGIRRPVGMSGVRLDANVTLITASHTSLENVTKCCERAGVGVMEITFEGIASAKAVLRPYERESGVAVIDLGGGSTDVTVFRDGGLIHAASIPVGGNHFTNDIAIGLKISQHEAERVKRTYGYAVGGTDGPQEMVVKTMDGRPLKMRRANLGEIILPRCEEVFELIMDEIADGLIKAEASCIVLTGGAALLEGIDRVAEAKLGIPVRLGVPENMEGSLVPSEPMYSTGVGLVLHAVEEQWSAYDDVVESIKKSFRVFKRALTQPILFGLKKPRNEYGIQRNIG